MITNTQTHISQSRTQRLTANRMLTEFTTATIATATTVVIKITAMLRVFIKVINNTINF